MASEEPTKVNDPVENEETVAEEAVEAVEAESSPEEGTETSENTEDASVTESADETEAESSEETESDEESEKQSDVESEAGSSDRLTPKSVAQKSSSSDDSDTDKKAHVKGESDFWKNVSMILITVIIVGAIAGVAGYFAGKARSSKSETKTEDASDSETKTYSYLAITADKIAKSKKNHIPHKDVHFTAQEIRDFCTENGLMITDGTTASGFLAFNDTMKVIVTVERLQAKTFDILAEELVFSSAPLNSREMMTSDNYLKYEGYLDKDQPELGYCVLELICGDEYLIFVQGLGETAADPEIAQTLVLGARLDRKIGLK